MQVFVAAGEEPENLRRLHSDIGYAVKLALPRLWDRLVPQRFRDAVDGSVDAMEFLQRATPGDTGVTITFSAKRALAYLASRNLPVIDEEPSLNLEIQLYNQSGQAMTQSASLLRMHAADAAADWGIALQNYAPSLILQWRWLDPERVNLIARGTSRLGEFSETRRLEAGDPVSQLQEWLVEVLLHARDARALSVAAAADGPDAVETQWQAALPADPGGVPERRLLLTVERQASLAEQVLFEDDLGRDPHVTGLLLQLVDRDRRQYRLHVQGVDDRWLVEWFGQRGMELTAVAEGWVAR